MVDPVLAVLGLAAGAIAVAAWGSRRAWTHVSRPATWMCQVCGVPNEWALEACWSCGRGVGEPRHDPSHIPRDRRWPCPACASWNGIARETCWHCAAERPAGVVTQDPVRHPARRVPPSVGASIPRGRR